MKTTVSSRGRIALPAELRRQDGILPGQTFEIQRIAHGKYLLKKHVEGTKPGLVDWLLSCPEKGWFQPVPSESTETL